MEGKEWVAVSFPTRDTLDGVLAELIRIFTDIPALMRSLGEGSWELHGLFLSHEQPKGVVADALRLARANKKIALYQREPDFGPKGPEEGECVLLFAIAR